jgi:hypothetical protein
MFEIFKTIRGSSVISENGYRYTIKNKSSLRITWRCTVRTCRAKIITSIEFEQISKEINLAVKGQHVCAIKPGLTKRLNARNRLKDFALQRDSSSRDIINEVNQGENQSTIAATGTLASLEQIINRVRRNVLDEGAIVEPALNIGSDLAQTLRGHRLFQFGPNLLPNLENETRMVIFFSDQLVVNFINSEIWSIDGTFSVCPLPWTQLYTISMIINHHVVPVVYALLKTKSQSEYRKMLNVFKRFITDLNPSLIILDFEKAAISAFSDAFPCVYFIMDKIFKKVAFFWFIQIVFK